VSQFNRFGDEIAINFINKLYELTPNNRRINSLITAVMVAAQRHQG
jgi:hypothetical protein